MRRRAMQSDVFGASRGSQDTIEQSARDRMETRTGEGVTDEWPGGHITGADTSPHTSWTLGMSPDFPGK